MNPQKHLSLIPPPWVLVLIGLVLNILAILVSSVLVESYNQRIGALSAQEAQNQYAIQLDWNGVETLERKREALLLHSHLSRSVELPQQTQAALIAQLQLWTALKENDLSLQMLPSAMMAIDNAQQGYRERIDTHYLNNLEIAEQIDALQDKVAHYRNIALFLQIFGLALIIARDLARNP
ncbi:DNA mismatch repair protein [Vibrio astriarenae]